MSIEEVDKLARTPHSVVISCGLKLNLDYLLVKIWDYLQLSRVYTKRRGGVACCYSNTPPGGARSLFVIALLVCF